MTALRGRVGLALVLLALAMPALAATGGKPAVSDFAVFDRAYIPVLALSSAGRLEAARQAMARLEAQWPLSEARMRDTLGRDPAWPGDAERIAQAIATARSELDAGRTAETHQALEPVREILWHARQRQGIAYFVDGLTAHHAPMEAIVLATRGRDALSRDEMAQIAALHEAATATWSAVLEAPLEPAALGLGEAETGRLHALLAQEASALQALGEALRAGNAAAVLRAGPAVKPPFAEAMMLFGDFAAFRQG